MSPPDDRPEIVPAEPAPSDERWLDELHNNPAYLRILDEIDLDDTRPGIPAEKVLAWVRSWGTNEELPIPTAE